MTARGSQDGSVLGALTLRDLLVYVFYHAKLIRNCLLAGLLIGVAAAALSRTEHTADSLVMVLNGPGGVAPEQVSGLSAIYAARALQSDVEILQSEPVLQTAAQKVGLGAIAPEGLLSRLLPKDEADRRITAAAQLRKGLRVQMQPESNLIRVSYTSPDRATAVLVVQAVVDAYAERRRSIYANSATGLQEQEVQRYAALLGQVDARIKDAQARFGVLDVDQDVELAANRQDNLGQRMSQVRERARAVEAELAVARSRLASTAEQVFESRQVSNATPNDEARNTVLRLRQERARLAEQYQPTWPAIRELDARIAVAERQVRSNAEDRFFTERKMRNPNLDQLSARVSTLAGERAALSRQLQELQQQAQASSERINGLRQGADELRELMRQRDVFESIYKQLSTQQATTKLQNDAVDSRQASMRVVQPATAPVKGRSMALLYVLGGLFMGAVAAGAVVIVATLGRQVFITPSEAERALRMPAIIEMNKEASDFTSDPGRRMITQVASLLVDANKDGFPLSVIQLAAAGAREDAASLAVHLGAELAQGWRQRTLVIDLDGEVYEALGASGAAVGKVELEGITIGLIRTTTPDLWVLTHRPQDEGPLKAARLTLAQAEKIIHGLRVRFDRILMLAPADFESYAARRLYGLADANLVVVRAETTRSPAAQRLREVILAAGGDILGMIFTHRQFYIPQWAFRWL